MDLQTPMTEALTLTGIDKAFAGFPALRAASFGVRRREVHALLGENGAGKTTLMNVAAGLYRPDRGELRVFGEPVVLDGPRAARKRLIGMVHQHFKLVPTFTATENIMLALEVQNFAAGRLEIRRRVGQLAEDLGFPVPLDRPVGTLSIAEQQRVEILKALAAGSEILILDEPTAVLTDEEGARLLANIRRLAERGTAVVLVTHKLRDVIAHADRVTVMRGGATVTTADPRALSLDLLTALVVGEVVATPTARQTTPGAELLVARGLSVSAADGPPLLDDVGFTLRAGEILGIAGVGGNGQTELVDVVSGVRRADRGSLRLAGEDLAAAPVATRRARGFAVVPADRKTQAMAGDLSVSDNYAVGGVLRTAFGGAALDHGAMRRAAGEAVAAFDVQGVHRLGQKASLLSGGNAQKLVLAREFSADPKVVVVHSPSRGLDMRAMAAVHARLREARDRGAAVLLVSEDLDEILALSDRVAVMSRGRITAEFPAPVDRQAVGRAMVDHG
ncbi:ABC transporter ATP-binding protein [Methylobrevis pamukkalensis]|uniref:Ribose import ATP-binding protein RbsA n=1 Tax=Methylobrevis pamukkalensis TaxID=1439726 RepID=A0A1E3H440_9HYPH|nr:ABC transporter ATP-binding protein [Methylobrevis pamukkalensis]ODN71117.1 Ribose import ATP-binding protein RbsA [Methylobrevis pamukkalensis]